MPTLTYDINQIGAAVNDYLTSKLSLDAVGEKFRMSRGILRHWVIQFGYKPRKNGDWKYDQSKVDECCDLYLKGGRTKELAKKYNVDRRTIMDWLIRQGITPKKFNETLGVTPEMKQKARDLYINEKLNCCDIAKLIGVSNRSVLDWIKDVKRSQSEIAAIKIVKNGGKSFGRGRSKYGSIHTKFGKIHYDSSYERDRIIQLDSRNDVVNIQRCKDSIKYGKERYIYIPDFLIEYENGNKVIEEIKPLIFVKKIGKETEAKKKIRKINLLKFKYAKKFYKDKNVDFRVITEEEIYEGVFKGNKTKIKYYNGK